MQSVTKLVLARAAMVPDANAVVLPDRAMTFGMLAQAVGSVARHLAAAKLSAGKPVGVLVDTPSRHLVITLALAKIGLASIPLRRDIMEQVLKLHLADVVCDAFTPTLPARQHVLHESWFTEQTDHVIKADPVAYNAITRVEFTSGSTGAPKAIAFTDGAILNQTINIICSYALDAEAALCLFKITSNVGLGFALSRLILGKAVAFTDSNDNSIDLIAYHRLDAIAGSPLQVMALVDRIAKTKRYVRGVKTVILAGGQMSGDELARIREHTGADIRIDYGATETGPSAFAAGTLVPYSGAAAPALIPHQTINIDECGEVCIQTTGMGWPFTGEMTQTPEDCGDGWFRPGDTAMFDNRGLMILTGRADDLINLGGVKVSPELIESTLRTHPQISDAAIKPAEDSTGRKGLEAFVVMDGHLNSEDLKTWIQHRVKDVRIIKFNRVETIPKTDTGKVDRQKL